MVSCFKILDIDFLVERKCLMFIRETNGSLARNHHFFKMKSVEYPRFGKINY